MRPALVGVLCLLASAMAAWLFLSTERKSRAVERSLENTSQVAASPVRAPSIDEPTRPSSGPETREASALRPAANSAPSVTSTEKRHEHVARQLTDQIASAGKNVRWTREIRDAVTSKLASPELRGSTLRSAGCSDSICKLEVDHQSEGALHEFMQSANSIAGGGGGMAFRDRTEEGEFRTVVFLARAGSSLPVER